LTVVLIDPLPNIPKLIPKGAFEIISMDVQPLVIVDQILQSQETLNIFDLLFDGNFLFFYIPFDFFSFGEIDQVDDHAGEVVRHVALSESLDDLAEDLVGLLGESAPFEHLTVHFVDVDLD
jgi:hypothetical protein